MSKYGHAYHTNLEIFWGQNRIEHIEPCRGTSKINLKIWVNVCKMLLRLIYLKGVFFSQINLIKSIFRKEMFFIQKNV